MLRDLAPTIAMVAVRKIATLIEIDDAMRAHVAAIESALDGARNAKGAA